MFYVEIGDIEQTEPRRTNLTFSLQFVLSADVVCSTNHQPFLHADSLEMHAQTWSCMQTACKFNVEQTEPLVWDCSMKKQAKSLVELTPSSGYNLFYITCNFRTN